MSDMNGWVMRPSGATRFALGYLLGVTEATLPIGCS